MKRYDRHQSSGVLKNETVPRHDQFKVYQLIWQRFMASKWNLRSNDTVSVEVSSRKSSKDLFAACQRIDSEVFRLPMSL